MRDDFNIEDRQWSEENHLEDRIERHEYRTVFRVTASKVRPDEYHGDAARYSDKDEPFAQFSSIREKCPGESGHEEGRKDPVYYKRERDLFPKFARLEEQVELECVVPLDTHHAERGGIRRDTYCLVADLAKDWIHHDQQTDCYGY